ncbi:unnamed protein product [Parascedosporium putredinis]|uniref:Cation diffusion facilitator 1 n=1 Tax=Parascedosporium putredinis TaxID=1442378 RepID=A0A9P1MA93_9PEZI|nr:unnamed protein product [Parascedosporium putredinis]CAI7993511.1 unnamed protein product [Parascedosporium putredinis]
MAYGTAARPNDVRTTPFKGNLDIFKTCCNMTDTSQDLVTLSDTEHSENPLCWGYCGLGATEGYADLQNRREAFYECYETKTAELGRENAGLDGIMCFGDRKALNSMQDTLPDSGPPNKGGAPAIATYCGGPWRPSVAAGQTLGFSLAVNPLARPSLILSLFSRHHGAEPFPIAVLPGARRRRFPQRPRAHRQPPLPPRVHPAPAGRDVEFQHSVRDPLNLASRIKDDAEIKANSSRRRDRRPLWSNRGEVQKFYEHQNESIRSMLKSVDEHEQEVKDERGKNNFMYHVCVKGSLAANVVLSGLQLYAAISSGSLSLFTTMADSVFDPFRRAQVPSGRARISTAGNIVFSFIMFSVSLVLIVMSARDLASGSEDETKTFNLPSVIAVAIAFGTKLFLFFLCWTVKDIYSQVDILWRDHRNDLSINGFGILTSVGGSKLRWWIDPMGAILLSVLIGGLWLHTAWEEFQLLIGVTADKETLQLITYISMTHSPLVERIDTVRAYHSGPRLLIEVDIVIDRNERLEIAHDVAEDLQIKLEKLPCVERAYVHIDYETSHKPEHDLKKLL